MQMHTLFKKKILQHIALHEATRVKRRPRVFKDEMDLRGKDSRRSTKKKHFVLLILQFPRIILITFQKIIRKKLSQKIEKKFNQNQSTQKLQLRSMTTLKISE